MTRGGRQKHRDGPERRCIATGESGATERLIRFVLGPDGQVAPDLAAKLPGRGANDVEVSIPNSVMGNAKIVNESGGPNQKFRIRIKVGVAYGSDIDQVEQVLVEAAHAHEEICDTPEPRVRFRAFGDSSLDFELLAWVEQPVLRGRLEHELNREVYKAFNEHGIEIPFPQQDLHIRSTTSKEAERALLEAGD